MIRTAKTLTAGSAVVDSAGWTWLRSKRNNEVSTTGVLRVCENVIHMSTFGRLRYSKGGAHGWMRACVPLYLALVCI